MSIRQRVVIGALSLSAAGFAYLALDEGYTDRAVIPVPGDVPTIGIGSTRRDDGTPVRMGDRITPPQAIRRAVADIARDENKIRECVTVPLHQYEYDAAVRLAYNIGASAFCKSTVVRRWNAGDYAGGCDAFLLWNKAGGRVVQGLVNRREDERRQCLGLPR